MAVTWDDALADLWRLVEAWCDRRALAPLRELLPAYPAPLVHSDQFLDLRTALERAIRYGQRQLQGDEEARILAIIAALDAHLRSPYERAEAAPAPETP